jgi:hypothetical protein
MTQWATIITGTVGIAGIGGTLLSARWQTASVKLTIAAEDERAKIAERRRIYVAAYAALSDGLRVMERSADDEVAPAVSISAINAARELELIASADVGRCARDALRGLDEHDGEALVEALAGLVGAMRADLGVEPVDVGDLW